MRSIINKISQALQVVLLAPIKLPGKVLNILKYVAVGLGVIESVLDNGKEEKEIRDQRGKEKDTAAIDVIDVGENQGLKMNADGAGEDSGGGAR